MFTFETADQREMRRFRMAQFNGRTATVRAGDTTITGHVRSVQEQEASVPPRWIITIIPNPPKQAATARRAAPHVNSFREDFY
ncbi:hypothetical protein [Bradyrhizobium sp. ARR65]|uniref:hypothetical protein n=1 Tax=Bradyrhizobium sp. ARR65 TaxID=1040989 RepID=UPI000463E16D|nr:hypothetical protein [Bradyrhizobium sp. ARR65]